MLLTLFRSLVFNLVLTFMYEIYGDLAHPPDLYDVKEFKSGQTNRDPYDIKPV